MDSGGHKDLPLKAVVSMGTSFITGVVDLCSGGGVALDLEEEGVALGLALGEEEVCNQNTENSNVCACVTCVYMSDTSVCV